jgi:hypothetical protein
VSTYETLLLLHFVSVGLLIGGEGVAMATGIGMSRTSDTRVIGTLARLSSTAEYVALIPGAIGTLVFGLWLIAILGMGQVVIIIAFLYLMVAKPGA